MKKMMVSLLVLAAMLSAAIVPADRAQKVAENYYSNYAPLADKGNTVQKVLTKEYMGQPTWYAIQFTKGFVIVSAEDTTRPILGYSFDGKVSEDLYNMDNPFINRFSYYDKQIVHNFREQGEVDANGAKEWKDIENKVFSKDSKAVIVDALVETNWGQGWPWNYICPTGTPVGCVATAMHMIMRFHQGPQQGAGSHTYTDNLGTTTGTHSVTFANATYDWSLMQALTSGQVTTTAQRDEMAELSYHCGVSVDMDYETDGSGAFISDVPAALETYFGFSTDAAYGSVGTVSNETTWSATIRANLDAYRPIEWGGSGTSGGHAFILDGYTDDYWYHFNWGWDGYDNGWFKLNSLSTSNGDFTASQNCAYNLWINGLQDEWPPPRNLSGTLSNGEDVALSWQAPDLSKYGTLTGYIILRNGVEIGSVGSSTLAYNDNDLSEGYYTYTVKATYTSPDGNSLISNAYYASVVASTTYPPPTMLNSQTMGRTSIDLSWNKPWIGTVVFSDNFEDGNITGWTQKQSKTWGTTNNFWSTTAVTDFSAMSSYPDFGTDYVNGQYSAGCTWWTSGTYPARWLASPTFTASAGLSINCNIGFYGSSTYPSDTYVMLYWGTFTEKNPTTYVEVLHHLDYTTESSEVLVPYSFTPTTTSGTVRLAFMCNYYDQWEFAVDDIVIGAEDPGAAPSSYDIYRNGSFAANVSVTGTSELWSDTNFADGLNEYFVKAVYPAQSSIPSNRTASTIIANPVPQYLTGILNANQTDVDLSWYAPLYMPPHWFGFVDEELDSYFDNIEGYTGTWARRRTIFTASGLGLGYAYPFVVDSLAAAFYEDTENMPWTDSDFTFDIYTSNYAGTADSVIMAASPVQTAVSEYWTTYALPSQLTMNWGWYTCVNVNDNGTPSSLVNYVPDSHSAVYYGGDGSMAAGWYGITFGESDGDWAIICFGQASLDDWFYNKSAQPQERLTLTPEKALKGHVLPDLDLTTQDTKAMAKYNVWRNGVDIADVVSANGIVNYTDVGAPAGDNTYYITAVYSDPAGESVASESVMVTVPGSSTPDTPTNVVTSVVSNQVVVDWDDMTGATSYNVYYSADPYGTYNLLTSVGTSQYTYTGTETKMFFQITSSNSKAAAPKTIEIAKPATR